MPTYKLNDVKALILEGSWEFATRKSQEAVRELGLLEADAVQLLLGLRVEDFRRVFGMCGHFYGEDVGDDYKIWVDLDAMRRCEPRNGICLYVKFCVTQRGEGNRLLVVSFHPQRPMYE